MTNKIPFCLRGSVCIGFELSEYSREQRVRGSDACIGIKANDMNHIDHYAHNTLIDIDDWLIGTLDPHKLGDISNV